MFKINVFVSGAARPSACEAASAPMQEAHIIHIIREDVLFTRQRMPLPTIGSSGSRSKLLPQWR